MVKGKQAKSSTSPPERPAVPTLAQMESDILLAAPDDPVFTLISSDNANKLYSSFSVSDLNTEHDQSERSSGE